MSEKNDRPLARAAERNRGKPGRPKKAQQDGHTTGTSASQVPVDRAFGGSALAVRACEPRLLSLQDASLYLGISCWTLRSLEYAGILARVFVPFKAGEVRKILFDRHELDRLIDAWKETPQPAGKRFKGGRPPGRRRRTGESA